MSQRTYTSIVEPVKVTPSDSTVSVLVTDTAVLAANTARKLLILKNNSESNPVYVSFDGDAADTNDMKLAAGEGIVLDVSVPTGQIRAIATGDTAALFVSEGV